MASRTAALIHARYFARELILKDLKLRFVGSKLGAAWLILEPLVLVMSLSAVFTLVGRLGFIGASEVPFPLFFYAGVLPWSFFASALGAGPNVFLADAAFLSKATFPREVMVLKFLGVALTELACSAIAFLLLMAWYGYWPNVAWLFLPVLILIALVLCAGVVFALGSLNVVIRDTATISRACLAVLFWFSPVVMTFDTNGPLRVMYYLNPMAGLIDGGRAILLHGRMPDWVHVWPSALISTMIFSIGYWIFRKTEPGFVDVL